MLIINNKNKITHNASSNDKNAQELYKEVLCYNNETYKICV